MQKKQIRRAVTQIVLGLIMMLPTACASGPKTSKEEIRIEPSPKFLRSLAHEYASKTCGPSTDEVVKDWVAQNEPNPTN